MEDVQRFNVMLRERDIPNIFLPRPRAATVTAGNN